MARFRLGLRVRQDWGALPRPSIGRQYTPMVQSQSAALSTIRQGFRPRLIPQTKRLPEGGSRSSEREM
jgi:hypothetical protein